MTSLRYGAILLAAGESTRMGRLKQLLPWQGTTLIRWQVEQLQLAGVAGPVVVLGHRAAEIKPAVAGTGAIVVVNDGYKEGRASSLRAGATNLESGCEAIAVCSVDQPRPASLIRLLFEYQQQSPASIVLPVHAGRRGHPTVLPSDLLPELKKVDDASLGLRAVVDRHAADLVEVEVDDDVIHLDLNTPEDYAAALDALRG